MTQNENLAIMNALECILSMLKMLCITPDIRYSDDTRKAAETYIDGAIKMLEETKRL